MHLINDLPMHEEKLGAWYDNLVLNFESAIMCINNVIVNVVVMNLRINYECRSFDYINTQTFSINLAPAFFLVQW